MKIRTFHPDINKFCRALFSGMSCGGFCGTFRNLWLNYIFSCNRKNLSQNATFSSVLAEIFGNSAVEDYICKKERQL